ncbi:carbohydrate-binding module family 50 protein [Hypoxylon sp. FL0890]|nr:carbohydrate-binding module family 50 protein [Hypoxylon sp. FL0890]
MKLSNHLLAQLGPFAALGSAYLQDPPTTADPNTVSDCSWWIVATSTDTCAAIAGANGISVSDFELVYNPSVGADCTLNAGQSYCVERNFGIPPVTTTNTSSAPTSTTTGNGITTPTPSQPGMVSNCNKFDFVSTGDSCSTIAARNGITVAQLSEWNDAGADCTSLWGKVYVCVGVIGTITTTTTTSTTTGNGITTPTPTQPGMVSNCNKFDFVNKGDSCSAIASRNDITVASLIDWNNAGTDCTSLWGDVYVCVGIVGTSTTLSTSTTTTTTGNGISTPTPTQPGWVSNCSKFDFVNKGDSCSAIASRNGISVADLILWNNGGTDCTSIWALVYVCVGVLGSAFTNLS